MKLELLEGRVEDPLVLDPADAHRRDRAVAKGILETFSAAEAATQREHVGVVLLVGRDDVDEHLDFVLEALGKERPDGAVDDAAPRGSRRRADGPRA